MAGRVSLDKVHPVVASPALLCPREQGRGNIDAQDLGSRFSHGQRGGAAAATNVQNPLAVRYPGSFDNQLRQGCEQLVHALICGGPVGGRGAIPEFNLI